MIKLVVFDLDGVLVDACEWHRVALNKALKALCDYEISLEEHYSTFNGVPTKVKLQKLTEMNIISPEIHQEIYEKKQELTIEIIKQNAEHREEKVQMIKDLRFAGYYIACYTNSIRETALLMLEKTGVLEHLDILVTNQDVVKSKPDPEGYNFLINKFNASKNNVIIVEDSPKGLAAAYATGCTVIKVSGPDEVDIALFKEYIK
jgi:HAD superfamily hydrolase (TIGR01509 family)